jgi:hypothetical protein
VITEVGPLGQSQPNAPCNGPCALFNSLSLECTVRMCGKEKNNPQKKLDLSFFLLFPQVQAGRQRRMSS